MYDGAVILGLLAASPSLLAGQSLRPPGTYSERIDFGGYRRTFRLWIPPVASSSRALPVVVLLHGWLADGRSVASAFGFIAKSQREGFILVAPEGLGAPQGWNVGFLDLTGNRHPDDAGFVAAVIDRVAAEARVDPNRIFVAGHSNGAMLALLVGARFGNRVAAIAAVAGTVGVTASSGRGYRTIPNPVAPVSVMVIHGRADGMVAYDRNAQALLVGMGAADSAKWWVDRDRCSRISHRTVSADRRFITETYPFGSGRTEVTLVTAVRGTHDWPGSLTPQGWERLSGFNATDMIWDFFRTHPKARP